MPKLRNKLNTVEYYGRVQTRRISIQLEGMNGTFNNEEIHWNAQFTNSIKKNLN